MRIIALDPGLTTGYAKIGPDLGVNYHQIHGRFNVYTELRRAARTGEETVLVCEDWKPRAGALSEQVDPHRIIGWAEGFAHNEGWPFVLQQAGSVKGKRPWMSDDKLRRIGWWVPGKDHARDALKHLAFFICTSTKLPAVFLPERVRLHELIAG